MGASFETFLEPVRNAIRTMAGEQDPDRILGAATRLLSSAGAVWAGGWVCEEDGWLREAVQEGAFPGDADLLIRQGRTKLRSFDPSEVGMGAWSRAHDVAQVNVCPCIGDGTLRGVLAWSGKRPMTGAESAGVCMLGDLVGGFLSAVAMRRKAEDEHARLAERLLHLQRLEGVGLLASGVAHDFNNLLAVIVGNASLAQLRREGDAADRALIDDIITTARRGEELTHQLLAYSGKAPFRCDTVDLAAQVSAIVGLVRTVLPRKVHLGLELSPAWIEADTGQIQQLAMNLVMNAAEAVGEGGEVVLRTGTGQLHEEELEDTFPGEGRRPGRYAWLEVEDDGPGMDDPTRARIFDPFFTTKGIGRGLGLPAVAEIARNHDGAVRFESAPGRGTWFRAWFPAAVTDGATRGADLSESPRGAGLVLVVDDLADVRSTARMMLEHLGYTVVEAEDGAHALRMVQENLEDLSAILLDLSMPVMEGGEVLDALAHVGRGIPVVVSSGHEDLAERVAGKGVDIFLQKPYTVQALARALARAMGRE